QERRRGREAAAVMPPVPGVRFARENPDPRNITALLKLSAPESRPLSPARASVILLDSYQYIDNYQFMNKIAVITGATRNLGFSLAEGLARRLASPDIVYLTGRDAARVSQSIKELTGARAQVRGEVLDVSKREAVSR